MRLADRARPDVSDGVLAVGMLLASQVELWVLQTPVGPRPLLVLLAVLACVPLAWRRVAPLVAVAGAVASIAMPFPFGFTFGLEADSGLFSSLAQFVAVHAMAAYAPWRRAVPAAGAILGAQLLILALLPNRQSGDYLFLIATFGAAFGAGLIQARQRSAMSNQARRAQELLWQQRERDRELRAQERRQIARELHDVIAHGVAVMVVQSGAAEALLPEDAAQVRQILGAVQNTGAQAAVELRRLLGLLGADSDHWTPAPRLSDVDELVTELRAAGLSVELRSDGVLAAMAPGLELAAYRIVQEALTNVVKHAPGAHADVVLSTGTGVLDIVVADRGTPNTQPAADGHGLVGMRERVELYGGTLTTGATESGFTVHARLPIDHTDNTLNEPAAATAAP